MNKSQKILEFLKKIPKGRVTTYGFLAKKFNTSPRAVGQILKNNPNPQKYPCYKVVKSDGSIGGYFGAHTKKKILLLKKDGIKIKNNKIDLKKYMKK